MKKSKFLLCLSTAAITMSVFIFTAACHKAKTTTTTATEDMGYTTDQSTSEKTFDDVQSIADQGAGVASGGTLAYKTSATTLSACATVTKTTGNITIDFGATNCLCHDGVYRRGQIVVTYTGAYADSGSTHTITFNNFYQNDNQVTGTKTVTNMGHNSAGQPYFNISVTGSLILAGGAGTVSCSWTRVRTWTAGYTTLTDWTDDVYQITGSGSITRANGNIVSISITSPLVVALNCRWIEAGTVVYTLPSTLTRTLNYGSTAICDAEAVLTMPSGTNYNITLH